MSTLHPKPPLDISVWLDREAARFSEKATRDIARAERLREAAGTIRSLRAELVKARMAKTGKS